MSIAEKLNTIAENMAKLQNVTKLWFDRGRDYEQQVFWNTFQINHNTKTERTNYEYAFAGQGWNKDILKPIRNIKPSTATGMFLNTQFDGDLRKFPEGDFPVELDFSNCTAFANCFAYAYGITGVGTIDARNGSSNNGLTAMFNNCWNLVTIEKLILKNDGSQTYGTNPFYRCDKLENIEIVGAFGQNTNFQHSKNLTKSSIESIINALYSGASEKTLTLPSAAKGKFTDDEWNALVATKSNWTISLA